jgi:hypothetical protein
VKFVLQLVQSPYGPQDVHDPAATPFLQHLPPRQAAVLLPLPAQSADLLQAAPGVLPQF